MGVWRAAGVGVDRVAGVWVAVTLGAGDAGLETAVGVGVAAGRFCVVPVFGAGVGVGVMEAGALRRGLASWAS